MTGYMDSSQCEGEKGEMKQEEMVLDEMELLEQAQRGNSDAITALLENYKSMVRALARPLFLMDGEQDDLVQEGMIGLFKAIQTYDRGKGTAFESFANTCIRGQLYTAVKKSNRKKNQPLNSYISLYSIENGQENADKDGGFVIDKTIPDWQNNPERIVVGREQKRDIQERLCNYLSKMEIQVLDLFLQGLTYQEIAGKLDKAPKSIDNALQRIKSKIKKIQDIKES